MAVISNEVLLEKILHISDTIKKNQEANSQSHQEIITQCKLTNGRVTRLEKWKNIATGALLLMNLLGIPMLLMLAQKFLNSIP